MLSQVHWDFIKISPDAFGAQLCLIRPDLFPLFLKSDSFFHSGLWICAHLPVYTCLAGEINDELSTFCQSVFLSMGVSVWLTVFTYLLGWMLG